ncbi:hypothetical protein [Natranaerobius thermophilus]|uniref:Glycosyl hydrolase BNR repeat-containing protein n=1 Tax=Natranaerobius thermophilus (strain ATCC BAA-1301 / DSM 18059 / JW/NM-WN-LF) TaxID=457570 RepID=B2A2A4_NATTJ|nr:hypothetical protein [Natranaerobius thermophilus]ACB86210.1 glycosyl hydrolase BNR repeat-containing protein [Natranaerobius thermophilus JW/NM-WN-LF]
MIHYKNLDLMQFGKKNVFPDGLNRLSVLRFVLVIMILILPLVATACDQETDSPDKEESEQQYSVSEKHSDIDEPISLKDKDSEQLVEGVRANPMSKLEIVSVENHQPALEPRSVGIDDRIYGTGEGNTLWRGSDAFEDMEIFTGEDVFDFQSHGYGTPYFVTRTASGYIVVTDGESEENRGAIFFSENFTQGYELKEEFTYDHHPIMFGNTWYHGEYEPEQIVLLAERGDGKGKLWATFDGGKSWENIRTAERFDEDQQLHHHTAVYDPYQGRIWNSQGDGANAALYISDDLGKSWRNISGEIETDLPHNQFQPTLLAPTMHTIIFGGDSGGTHAGLLEIPRDHDFEGNQENFVLERAIGVWDQQPTYKQYGTAPYAQEDSEIYIVLPSAYDDEKRAFVVGSGDHGRSFHLLGTYPNHHLEYGEQLTLGIVGPCRDGYLYGIWDTEADEHTMVVFDPPEWEAATE